jgi:hypothetical protein
VRLDGNTAFDFYGTLVAQAAAPDERSASSRTRPSSPPTGERPTPPAAAAAGGTGWNWGSFFTYVLGALLIVAGAVCGVVAYRMVHDHDSFQRSLGRTVPIYVPSPEAVFDQDRIYVLLMGIDYDYDSKDDAVLEGRAQRHDHGRRLDFPTKSVEARVGAARYRGDRQRARHQDQRSVSDGGVKLADSVIGDFLGFPVATRRQYFDRYVVININASRSSIDAIGGIDVPVPRR